MTWYFYYFQNVHILHQFLLPIYQSHQIYSVYYAKFVSRMHKKQTLKILPQGNLFKYFDCIISNHRTEIVLRNKNKLKWWYLKCDCENKSNICRNCQILTWNLTIYQCFQPCRVLTPETRLDKYSHLDVQILMLYKCWHPQLTTAIGS